MTLDWAQFRRNQQCNSSHCIHQFQFLFYLHAENFIDCSSLEDVILKSLLPEDTPLSFEKLRYLLQNEKILMLVDAFDEAKLDHPLLEKLITSKIHRTSSVVITSRPNYLTGMMISRLSSFGSISTLSPHKNLETVMGRTRSLFDPDQSLYFLLAFRGRTTYRH
jgi:hypothetical protein